MIPRIPPADVDELDEDARELLARVDDRGSGATNVFRTLVRNKSLFRYFIPYGGKLLNGKLPPRLRELVILHIAHECNSSYEWHQHVKIAMSIGIASEEIEAIRSSSTSTLWTELEVAALRAVDELGNHSTISSDVWNVLASGLDQQQLIELPLLVGHFQGVAYLLNSIGIQIES